MHAPGTLIGWGWGWLYGLLTFSLLEVGQIERAHSVSWRALGVLSKEDRAELWIYATLELAHATALAMRGDRASADALVRARVERLQAAG